MTLRINRAINGLAEKVQKETQVHMGTQDSDKDGISNGLWKNYSTVLKALQKLYLESHVTSL